MEKTNPTFLNNTNWTGLDEQEVKNNRQKFGKNVFKTKETPVWKQILVNFKEPMMILLVIALSALLAMGIDSVVSKDHNGEDVTEMISTFVEAGLILLIIFISIGLSLWQENKVKKVTSNLENLTNLSCFVIRNNQIINIKSSEVVVGDLLYLQENSIVAADAKLLKSQSLKIDETILVGHHLINTKDFNFVSTPNLNVEMQKENVFQGTKVVHGFGIAEVFAIGKNTQLSILKQAIVTKPTKKSYLEKQIGKLSLILGMIAGSISIAFFFLYILAVGRYSDFTFGNNNVIKSLSVSISLAIATIPEGLLAIVAVILTGVANTLKSNYLLVKKMPSIVTFSYVDEVLIETKNLIDQNDFRISNIYSFNQKDEMKSSELLNLFSFSQINYGFDKNSIFSFLDLSNYEVKDIKEEYEFIDNKLNDNYELLVLKNKKTQTYLYLIKTFNFNSKRIWNVYKDQKDFKKHLQEINQFGLTPICLTYFETNNLIKDDINNHLSKVKANCLIGLCNVTSSLKMLQEYNVDCKITTEDSKENILKQIENSEFSEYKNSILTKQEMLYILNNSENKQDELNKFKIFCELDENSKLQLYEVLSQSKTISYAGGVNSDSAVLSANNLSCVFSGVSNIKTNNLADIIVSNDSTSGLMKIIESSRQTILNIKSVLTLLLSANLSCLLTTLVGILVFMVEPLASIQLLIIDILAETIIGFPMMNNFRYEKVRSFKPKKQSEFILDKIMILKIVIFAIIVSGMSLLMFYIGASAFYNFNYSLMTNTTYGITANSINSNLIDQYPYWQDNGLINYAVYAGSSLSFMTLSLCLLLNGLCFRTNQSIFKETWKDSKKYLIVIAGCFALFAIFNYIPYLNTTFSLEPYMFSNTYTGGNYEWFNLLPYLCGLFLIGSHELLKIIINTKTFKK